jgi:hypothetical protein
MYSLAMDTNSPQLKEGSIEWVAEVRIHVSDIRTAGSARKGAEAANLALDVFGFKRDARFIFQHKGRNNWRRIMSRSR